MGDYEAGYYEAKRKQQDATDELKRRSHLLVDMIEDWVTHTSDPHYRIEGLTDDGEGNGEEWTDADFVAVLRFLEQCVDAFDFNDLPIS